MSSAVYETAGGTKLLDPEFILAELDVQPAQHVADLGSGGGGHFTFPLARRVGRSGIAYAVDVVSDVLEAIKRRAKLEGIAQIQAVRSNLEVIGATAIAEETLDRALCINVLFQNIHHDHILKEAHRLLKPGGKLLVVDWKQDTGSVGPPASRRINPQQLQQTAADVGFDFDRTFAAGQWHFGMVFVKRT